MFCPSKTSICWNRRRDISWYTLPWPERSRSMSPFSVPISRLTPHRAAHRISELNRFLYFRISGVSLVASWVVGVTLTLIWLSRRDGPDPPAPNPKVKKLLCFCCSAYACIGKVGWWWEGEVNTSLAGIEEPDGNTKDFEGVDWADDTAARYWNARARNHK